MTTATYQHIIHAAEVWTSDESSALRPVNPAEGLSPGVAKGVVERTVAELSPVIINRNDLQSSSDSDTYDALMGLPVIVDRNVRACLVLSITCPELALGAVEIWSRDNRDELGLNGAVFVGLSRFASISDRVKFPRGSGLPGQSWEDREPKLITGLGTSPNFMRAAGARAGGLDIGVALPVMTTEHELNSVVLLLSSKSTPIAKAFEIWEINDGQATLRKVASSGCDASAIEGEAMTYSKGEGLVGRIWESGVPLVSDELTSLELKRIASLTADGLSSAIGIPIYVGDSIKSVFLMFN